MRWASYTSSRDRAKHEAVFIHDRLHALPAATGLLGLPRTGEDGLAGAAERAQADPFEVVALSGATLLAPVPVPPSARDFMAFEKHVVDSMAALGATVDPMRSRLRVSRSRTATCARHRP